MEFDTYANRDCIKLFLKSISFMENKSTGAYMKKQFHTELSRLQDMLSRHKPRTLFQPIVSIEDKQVLGFEAFSRGIVGDNTSDEADLVELFCNEEDPHLLFELDKICCRTALSRFKKFLKQRDSLCIFINLDARALSKACCDQHFISEVVREINIPARNIVIEISAECLSSEKGVLFVEYCRGKGFQISIDKVEHNSRLLGVLLESRPDFIKLQRSVWSDPADMTFNLSNIDYIVRNCASVDCVPIAIGVEQEDEALYLLQANLFCHQGYYYTRSKCVDEGSCNSVQGFLEAVERVNSKFKKLHAERIQDRKEHFFRIKSQIHKIASLFSDVPEGRFSALMKKILEKYDDVISLFVLNDNGEQITQRFARNMSKNDPKQYRAVMTMGSDHSLRDYFMHLLLGYENFVTPPQLSPFLSKPTIIVSYRFFNSTTSFYLLCVEFPAV